MQPDSQVPTYHVSSHLHCKSRNICSEIYFFPKLIEIKLCTLLYKFYFTIFIAAPNSVYSKPLLLSVVFYRLNVYIYICFIMSKEKSNTEKLIQFRCWVRQEECNIIYTSPNQKFGKGKILFPRYFKTNRKTQIFVTDKWKQRIRRENLRQKKWTVFSLISVKLNKYKTYLKWYLLWCIMVYYTI